MQKDNVGSGLDLGAEVEALDDEASIDEEPDVEGALPGVDQSNDDEVRALRLENQALKDQNKNLQGQMNAGGVKVPKAKKGYTAVKHPGTKGDVSFFKDDIFEKKVESA